MVGGLISAGASILGGMMANDSNQSIAEANNATSLDIAKNGMQYKVADLKAAGLNPALAYNSGPIQMPNLSTPVMQNTAAHAGEAFAAYQQSQVAKAQIDSLNAQADLSSAQAARTRVATMIDANEAVTGQSAINSGSLDSQRMAIQASMAASAFEQLKYSTDYNTIEELNNFASKNGFQNFQALVDSKNAQLLTNDLVLKKLQVPEASAMAGMWSSDYGKHVAPYISSASQAAGPVGGAIGYMLGRGSRAAVSSNSAGAGIRLEPYFRR